MNYQSYATDIKFAVIQTGNPALFATDGVKTSSARNWISGRFRKPVDIQDFKKKYNDERVIALEKQVAQLTALLTLYFAVNNIVNISLRRRNIRSIEQRRKIFDCIVVAENDVGICKILEFLGVSKSRYYEWQALESNCQNKSRICTQRTPNQLTADELNKMKSFVTSKKYAHMPIVALYYFAKRSGDLYCSLHSWYR